MAKKNGKKASATKPIRIEFILDRSGSMSRIRQSVIDGFNEYLNGLKVEKTEGTLTLTQFDNISIEPTFGVQSIVEADQLSMGTYIPRGNTPLYDAVCKTVARVEGEVDDDQPVLVNIMTDGLENASTEYTQKDLQAMVKRLTDKGNWTFTFMGANMDSFAVARDYGILAGNVMDWAATPHGAVSAFHNHSLSTASYARSVAIGAGIQSASFYGGGGESEHEHTVDPLAKKTKATTKK